MLSQEQVGVIIPHSIRKHSAATLEEISRANNLSHKEIYSQLSRFAFRQHPLTVLGPQTRTSQGRLARRQVPVC